MQGKNRAGQIKELVFVENDKVKIFNSNKNNKVRLTQEEVNDSLIYTSIVNEEATEGLMTERDYKDFNYVFIYSRLPSNSFFTSMEDSKQNVGNGMLLSNDNKTGETTENVGGTQENDLGEAVREMTNNELELSI